MKTLIVLDRLGIGGTELQMSLLIRNWPAEAGALELCVLDTVDPHQSGLPENLVIHELPRRRFDVGVAWRLRQLVARRDVDAVLAAHRYSGLVAKLAKVLGMSARVFCEIRGRHRFSWKQRVVYDWLDPLLMPLAAGVISNSRTVAESFPRLWGIPRKIEVVPNGLEAVEKDSRWDEDEVRRRHQIPLGLRLVVCVGRLVDVKDPWAAIAVVETLIREGLDVGLVWIGGGPLEDRVRAATVAAGLSDRVWWLGDVEDPRPLVRLASVFLHPSTWENLSNAILEAMAASRPVVARDVGGNVELIENRVNGVLVDPVGSGPLAEAVRALLENRRDADRMGRRAEARVEARFSVREMVNSHVRIVSTHGAGD